VLLLGGVVVVVSLGDVVVLFLCFLFFLWVLVPFAFVSVVVVEELDWEVVVCDCGCSEIELLEVEPFGLVEVSVPALGVWLCGVVVLWVWSGVAAFVVEFSGVGVVDVGFATLPAALLAAGVWDPETPDPSCEDGDALHVSAMCFTFVTVKFLADED